MADEKFLIEIILEARNRASEALKSVGVDVDNLQKNLKGAEKTVDSFDRHLSQLDAHVTKARDTIRSLNPTLDSLDRKFKSLSATTVAVDKGLDKAARGLEKLAPALATASKFADSLEEKLAKLDRKLTEVGARDVKAKVGLEGDEKTEAQLIAIEKHLSSLQKKRINIPLGVDQEILDREIALAEKKLKAAGRDDIVKKIRLEVDERSKALIDEKARAATASNNKKQDIEFNARGLAELRAEMEALNQKAQQLKREDIGFRAVLNAKEFNAEYENIRRKILELSAFKGDVHVGMDKAEFVKDFAEVEALAAKLGLKKETIKVVIDYDRSKLERISQQFGSFKGRAQKYASDFGDNFQITLRGVVNGALRLIVLFSEPLLSALTGVVGGLVAVGAAAGSAVGGLIGLASAAGAQAIPALGALAFALSRVTAVAQAVSLAYKEQQKTGQQQIGLDQARASAADAITSANEGLVKAQRAVIDAQKELTDARREGIRTLTDLSLAEQNAVLSAQKSRIALASTIGTGSGSVIEAELQARSDKISANRARVDNRRAQAGGIESLPAVEAAKRQLEDAVAGVTAAQRQLQAADRQAAAASERVVASANAFEQAFGQLSRGEKKLFGVFHNSDNTGLLDLFQNNLDSPIRKTTDIVLGGVARMAEGIRRTLLDPSIGKAFTNLGKSIAGAFDSLRTIKLGPFDSLRKALTFFTNEAVRNFKPLSKIVGELLSIFVSLGKAASGPLRDALDGVDKFLGRIADKASSKSGQNSLANFFDQGLKSLSAFLRLGGAFLNLFLAIIGPGGGADEGVKGIDRLTESINNAAGYIEKNGEKVRKFFHDSIEVTSQVLKIFVGIGAALVEAFDPKSVSAFSKFITDFVLPALVKIIKAIGLVVRGFLALANSPVGSEIGKWVVLIGAFGIAVAELVGFIFNVAKNLARLGEVIANVAKSERLAAAARWLWNGAVAAFNAAKQIAQLVAMEAKQLAVAAATRAAAIAQGIWNAVTSAAAYAQLIAKLIAVRAAQLATAAATRLMAGAQVLLNLAMSANPIVLAVAAIIALGVAFYVAYKKIKPFHEAVDAVFGFIKKHWKTIVEIMLGPLGLVIEGLRRFGPSMVRWIKRAASDAIDFVKDHWQTIVGVLLGPLGLVLLGIKKFGPGLLRAIKNAVSDVFDFFKKLPGRIGSILSDGIRNIGHIFESIGSRIVKAIVKGIKAAPKALWNALKDILPGPLKGAIGVIGKGLDAIGLASGARIGGNPSDGDSVHVRVKPGEVILNEDQQRSVGPSRINRALAGAPTVFASGSGYATGGGRAKGKSNVIDKDSSYANALIELLSLTRDDTEKIADEFTQMRSRIRKTLKNLNSDADDSWGDFYKTTRRALSKIDKVFTNTFKDIADVVYDAFKYISRATNDSLDALGADPVKFSLAKPKVGSSGQQMASGGVAGFIGNAGERGADMVHTVLGRGEAVLNWAHQRLVEPALNQVYGFGLDGMFKRVNAKHAGGGAPAMMASGGFTGPGHSGAGFTPVWNLARSKFGMSNFTGFDGHNKMTSTGNNISDHWYHRALDMSNGVLTKQEDALNNFFKTKVPQVVKQLIWRNVDQFRGFSVPGHTDHVHLAMKDPYAFNADRTAKILSRAMRGLSIDDLLVASDSAVAGGQTVDHVDRRRIKGPGPLARAGNKATEAVRRAANKMIDRKANRGSGGTEVGRTHPIDSAAIQEINHPFKRFHLGQTPRSPQLSPNMVVKLAQWAGLPGRLFEQIAHGESGYYPGIWGTDAGGTHGVGLWAITADAWGGSPVLMKKYNALGGWNGMFNPVKNAEMTKFLYDKSPVKTPGRSGFPWYGTRYVRADGGRVGMAQGGFARNSPYAGGGRVGSQPITATVFGSEGDFYDTEDANDPYTAAGIGYRGDNLRQKKWAFGEIADRALGHKPRGYKYLVSRGDKAAVLGKYDINGFDPGDGRKMDIWIHAAKFLNHFEKVGKGIVKIAEIAQNTPLGPYGGGGVDGEKAGPFSSLIGKIKGAAWGGFQANGGDYVVDKPTVFMAGEAGRERATFRPMGNGGFLSPAKLNIDTTDPTPVHRTHSQAPSAPAPSTTTTTTTPSDSGGGGSSDSGRTARRNRRRAEDKLKKLFDKLYEEAFKQIDKVLEEAPVDGTKVIAKATRSLIFKTLTKIGTKTQQGLDVISRAIDALFADKSVIARFEEAATERGKRIDLGTQKSRISKVVGKGRNTRVIADQRPDAQQRYDQRVLGDLGQKRDDLRTENSLLRTAGRKVSSGLVAAQNQRRAKVQREINKLQEKIEKDRAKAKTKEDRKKVKDLEDDLKDLKEEKVSGDDKLTKRFKSDKKRIAAKRAEIAKSLADNADEILAQQDVVQRDALDRTTGVFDTLRSVMDRTKRIIKARGKETPATIAAGFDGNIEANNEEVRQLAELAKKAGKSGNLKLAQEIQEKIDELNASTEELLAAKFQAAIDAVNDQAQKSLAFNAVQQKLAQVGVTSAQAAKFATTGTGIDLAKLGSTDYAALGQSLGGQGDILRSQRSGLTDLLAQATASGNDEQIKNLTQQIADLDASIVDNAKAIRDNTDAANAAAAEIRRTPLDQVLSVNNSGTALLKSMEALGINTTAEQQRILNSNAGIIGGQRNADSQSFTDAVNTYLPGGANFAQAATLSGPALINYIRGVIQQAQGSGKFNKDELAAITNYGNSIIADATALNDNTKALKDLTGSLTQTFTSTAWSRFRQAVFNGNGGLMPQYSPYIPSFGGGGVKRGDGLALLHDREVIFTPEQVQALNGIGGVEETHLHITSPVEKFDPIWASRQLSFARRNRG